ncbi:MAG TPA: hypothetical protein VLT58_16390 [Polyangia bacterium]|nr:hypothetical protein [Polyangia bacterium]
MTDTGWTALAGTIIGAIVTVIGVILKWRGDLAALAVKAQEVAVSSTAATATAADQAADNETELRRDLFALYKVEKTARQDLAKQYQADIKALRDQMAVQGRELAVQAAQLQHAAEDGRLMHRQLITLGQEMATYRAAMRDLQTREYIYWQYWNAIDQQGRVLHEIEWAEIKKAVADQNIPRPLWPALDAIDVPTGEDDASE